MALDLSKPIISATLEELKELLREVVVEEMPHEGEKTLSSMSMPGKKYVYGIAGLAKLLGCSIPTAQRVKSSGVLDLAISQVNRLLVIDTDYALDLLRVDQKWHRSSTVKSLIKKIRRLDNTSLFFVGIRTHKNRI